MYLKRLEELHEDNDLKQINISKFYLTFTDYILGLTNEEKPYP